MRNDLKDEPVAIPSLLIDDLEPQAKRQAKSEMSTIATKKNGASKSFVVWLLLLLLIIYVVGTAILVLFFKQSTDDLRYQLDQAVRTAASATEVSQQQALTSNGLENIRAQNKLLTEKLTVLANKQGVLATQLLDQEKRIIRIDKQLSLLAADAKQLEQIKPLVTEVASLKKSQEHLLRLADDVKALQNQNLSQNLKSIQDDLLLLRAQVDKVQIVDTQQLAINQLTKQVESLQTEIGKLRQQVSNMSPY